MKILLINSDVGYGSTGRITWDLYQAIIASGNDAIIGYGRECTIESSSNIKIGNQFDIYMHALKTRLFDLQGFGSINATKKFIQLCKDYKPDIIHLHNIHGSYINIYLLFQYIKEIKIPVVWTLHDCWAYTGHCACYSYVGCNKWKEQCSACIQKQAYPASLFLDHSARNYDIKRQLFTGIENCKLITVSNWLKEEVQQSFLNEYDSKVIPNGIDLTIFKPRRNKLRQKYCLEEKKIILGVASIWHDRKGLWLFNELADQLDDTYRILLVGINQKQTKLIHHKHNNVIEIARTDCLETLAEIYSVADYFINPSMEESFGMVSLESLACGTSVITNKYTANPELVDETCGIIVDDIKADLYINAIYELDENPKSEQACINRATLYEKNRCYGYYLDLYKEMYETKSFPINLV